MPINLIVKEALPKTNKRFTAIFRIHKGGKVIKITHFGQRNPKKGTYIDHGDKKLRSAYRARHQKKLIQILYPDKYSELWGTKEVETKKEEEPAAE